MGDDVSRTNVVGDRASGVSVKAEVRAKVRAKHITTVCIVSGQVREEFWMIEIKQNRSQ